RGLPATWGAERPRPACSTVSFKGRVVSGWPSSPSGAQGGTGEYPPTPSSRSWIRPVPAAQPATSARVRSGIASVKRPVLSVFLERSKIARQRMAWRLLLSIAPAKTLDRAAFHELAVELKAKSRPVRHRQAAVRVDPRLFDEDLAQGGCRPPRGVVRELEP